MNNGTEPSGCDLIALDRFFFHIISYSFKPKIVQVIANSKLNKINFFEFDMDHRVAYSANLNFGTKALKNKIT